MVGHLRGDTEELIYFVNVESTPRALVVDGTAGQRWRLHAAHRSPTAADRRAAREARFDTATGRFSIPPLTAVVFVRG